MRFLVLASCLFFSGPSWGGSGPCTAQDYSNPKKVPNWSCPGPDESIVVPTIRFEPSVGLKAGTTVSRKGAESILLSYDAVLLDEEKVMQLGLRIQGLRRLRWLERHKASDLLVIEKKYLEGRVTAQIKLEQSRVKTAVAQRDRARKERDDARRWYRSWSFGLVVGIVTTTAATVAVVYAAR